MKLALDNLSRGMLLFGIAVCIPCLAEESARRSEAPELSSEDQEWLKDLMQVLDESTELATKNRLNADYVPGMVTVLNGRDLDALGMATVWEALTLIPGVMPTRDPRNELSVSVRGFSAPFNSGNIKILLNNIPMSREGSGLGSQVLALPIGQVARIEFIRGPGAVLYGDFAYNGVLNVLTRKDQPSVFSRLDENGTVTAGGAYSQPETAESAGFSINLAGLQGDDVEAREGALGEDRQGSAIASFNYRGWQLSGQIIDREYDHRNLTNTNQNATVKEYTEAFEVRHDFEMSNEAVAALYVSYLGNDYEARNRRFAGYILRGDAELSWPIAAGHRLLLQGSYSFAHIDEAFQPGFGDTPSVDQNDINRRYYSISMQDQYDITDRLTVTAGLRFDHRNDLDYRRITPRLSAVWRITDQHILKAQYAEGYRAPTFWEIYPANTAIDIDPANIYTSEVSYINRVPDRVMRLTMFHSRLDDLIVRTSPPEFSFSNNGTSRSAGIELEWEQQWSPKFKTWFNVSYADTHKEQPAPNGAAPPEDPSTTDWLANMALFYRVSDQALVTAHWNYVGERHAENIETSPEHRLGLTLNLFNLGIEGLTLRLGVRNALHTEQRYLTSFPTGVASSNFPDSLIWGQLDFNF